LTCEERPRTLRSAPEPTHRNSRSARSTGVGVRQRAVLVEDARLEKRLHQSQDASVFDPTTHPIHYGGVRNLVEAGLDVALHDPLI